MPAQQKSFVCDNKTLYILPKILYVSFSFPPFCLYLVAFQFETVVFSLPDKPVQNPYLRIVNPAGFHLVKPVTEYVIFNRVIISNRIS